MLSDSLPFPRPFHRERAAKAVKKAPGQHKQSGLVSRGSTSVLHGIFRQAAAGRPGEKSPCQVNAWRYAIWTSTSEASTQTRQRRTRNRSAWVSS